MVVRRSRAVEPDPSATDGPSRVTRVAALASVLALLVLVAAGLQATGSAPAGASTGSSPVAASCIGPSLTHAGGPAGRGQTIAVTGTGFGTECYDTGPPPAGEGGLGPPHQDIELLVVQGDREEVVATGDADAAYGFRVDVVVPTELSPGEATLVARSTADPFLEVTGEQSLVITDAAATPASAPTVATFGPAEATPTTTTAPATTTTAAPAAATTVVPRTTEDEGGFPTTVVGGLVIAALVLAGAVLVARQHDAPA